MKKFICTLFAAATITATQAQTTLLPTPAGSTKFGTFVAVLPNGNIVVTDPFWKSGTISDLGAAFLFDGQTYALISTITGSQQGDKVGSQGIMVLPNGNYIIRSENWQNGSVANAGAVTWGNGTTGISGTVSSSNSLVGSSANDRVGTNGIVILPNGAYVVNSTYWDNGAATDAGAVTWGNGAAGINGTVSSSNSLVGTQTNDKIGYRGITVLPSGNYIVKSTQWANGTQQLAGAVTWASGSAGISGAITATNSLIGSHTGDEVGSVELLANGNYLVSSSGWDNGTANNAGFIAWANGTTGKSGEVSSSNALVGTLPYESAGLGFKALSNGNYVAFNHIWSDSRGAVTWVNGTVGLTGTFTGTNSITGEKIGDHIGQGDITELANGNYVVSSIYWRNGTAFVTGAINAGAVTWGSGTGPTNVVVNSSNSVVGSHQDDYVGQVYPLTNGNYVIRSQQWTNGTKNRCGSVTWANGATAGPRTTGVVSAANSLVGSQSEDIIGVNITTLTNGNYVLRSPGWSNGTLKRVGAATWGNGMGGTVGPLSSGNSLIGNAAGEEVSSEGITALANGNYVVASSGVSNGTIAGAGAVTWGNGATGITGFPNSSNSLVGTSKNDFIGSSGVKALKNGNYVVRSEYRASGNNTNKTAGAVTWGNGTTGITGPVTSSNSLVATQSGSYVGQEPIIELATGHYVVQSPSWANYAQQVGAVTWGNGTTGVSGIIDSTNSLVGNKQGDYIGTASVSALPNGDYLVPSPNWDNGTIVDAGAVTMGNGGGGTIGTINGCNSLVGSSTNSLRYSSSVYDSVFNRIIVGQYFANNKVVIFNPLQSSLAMASTQAVAGTGSTATAIIRDSSCQLISAVKPDGPKPVAGKMAASVYIQPTALFTPDTEAYCRRYYRLAPQTSADSNTARVTLYFTQADFDDYNANNGMAPNLPASASDAAGKGALRITQQRGNSATGAFGSFTGFGGSGGANKLIIPGDTSIVWNAPLSRWEVSFEVTGFGGFFLSAGNDAPLALPATGAFKNNRASVSPVPASSTVTITNNNLQLAGSTVTALNLQGQLMATAILESNTKMEVQNWPAGIYLLKFADGSVLKMVKQ